MAQYTVTYLESPEVNPYEARALGTVQISAVTRTDAARAALAMPLPDGADTEMVHVCPHDDTEECEFIEVNNGTN